MYFKYLVYVRPLVKRLRLQLPVQPCVTEHHAQASGQVTKRVDQVRCLYLLLNLLGAERGAHYLPVIGRDELRGIVGQLRERTQDLPNSDHGSRALVQGTI